MLAFAFADALIGLLPGSGEWASIEARAKAICNAPGLHPYAPQWDDLTESERDDFRKLAEAEMREKSAPTLGEREACAKVADEVAAELKGGALSSPAIGYGETVAVRIAAAIRARGAPA